MVRVFLKGGVWKNSEDEILKAAVMKYGKHQWARVASLLNRKSAKQCKARWHEWLDPSVRKVDWSRQEEEKLLHLAKLMPAQWKTIAPLVGRTAAQCQEHYEKLLDEAATATTTTGNAAASAGDGTATSSTDALRSQALRPGQIDSHPETKPARPDPIDMDEDEIEMLQEARARLANTQGKKAKRKAREKILAQAKRLADLQKRRELKQAGLLSSAAVKKARRRNRDIDLGVEIPFYKPAPSGFHDTSTEDQRAEAVRQKRWKAVDYHQVNEQQYRSRDREAAMAKKREQARLRSLERSNMEYVVAQVNKTNDPSSLKPIRSIGPMELPEPQIQDQDLVQLSKLQRQQELASVANSLGDASDNLATRALLGDYSDRPLPTPMRNRAPTATPAATQQSILRQASQLRRLEQGQTPLLIGGDHSHFGKQGTTEVDEDEDDAMGGSSVAQRNAAMATPATMPDRSGVGQTPFSHRDQLGLNRRPHSELRGFGDDVASVGGSTFATTVASIKELAREERRAAKRARKELEAALAALPAPQFEYELAAPQLVTDDDQPTTPAFRVPTDAADVEAAERERLRREANKLYEARSSVVKRKELPRPLGITFDKSIIETAATLPERLVLQEMQKLLQHDALAFPVVPPPEWTETGGGGGKKKGSKKRKKDDGASSVAISDVPLDDIPDEFLTEAKNIVQKEADAVLQEKIDLLFQTEGVKTEAESLEILMNTNRIASENGGASHVFVQGGWTTRTDQNFVESLRLEFETLQDATAVLRKRNDKLESKVIVKNGGYSKRSEATKATIQQTLADLQHSKIEESVFLDLQRQENQGGTSRCERLKEEIAKLQEEESGEQKHYSDLLLEKKRLLLKRKQTQL